MPSYCRISSTRRKPCRSSTACARGGSRPRISGVISAGRKTAAGSPRRCGSGTGRLDVHVNNAGVAPRVRLDVLETTEESYDFLMDINLKGTFFMCQAAANLMLDFQRSGIGDYTPRIVNIASMSAYTSSTNRGNTVSARRASRW